MTTTLIEATYEHGVLTLDKPLPLREQEKVRITVQTQTSPLLRAYGILGWTGSAEVAEQVALDPALAFPAQGDES